MKDIIVQEDNKSNEVVVKMVEGEDFKRWHLNHSGRYLLATGYDIDIPKKYPSVFKHLLTYETKLIKLFNIYKCTIQLFILGFHG